MDRQPIELHPEAIAEAREWYRERSTVVADAFMAELDLAIDQICGYSDRWAAYLHGTRRYLLKRFPYLVIYLQCDRYYGRLPQLKYHSS